VKQPNVRNRFFGLAGLYLDMFYQRGGEALPTLTKLTAPKLVWLSIYKDFPPIESISKKERWDLFRYVIASFPEYERMDKMDAARIVYTIGNCL